MTTAREFNLQSTEFTPMSTSIVKLVRDVFPGTRYLTMISPFYQDAIRNVTTSFVSE